MQQFPIARVAAFVGAPDYLGNNASVVILPSMLPDDVLQAVARRNGDSETAYLVKGDDRRWKLRWFTPGLEVDLCGHATMAAGHHLIKSGEEDYPIQFDTLSGELTIDIDDDGRITLDLPIDRPVEVDIPTGLLQALGLVGSDIIDVHLSRDLIVTVRDEQVVEGLVPDPARLGEFPYRGIVVTAEGSGPFDFVSRWFGGDGVGVEEDPVTGSSHAALAPLWSQRLDKACMEATQLSEEGGVLTCIVKEERVVLLGRCQTWLLGTVHVDHPVRG